MDATRGTTFARQVIAEAWRRHKENTMQASAQPLPYQRPNPNHQAAWLPTRPEFVIRRVGGSSTYRGYHESEYEIVSRRALDDDDIERLAECGLLGFGQQYDILTREKFAEEVPPVTIDRRTGKVVPDVPPTNWRGDPITSTYAYEWYRYTVRRICDSGD